jgi:hypothetical protein
MSKNNQRYLGMAVLSDKRYIRATYTLDGRKKPFRKAERLALATFKDLLETHKGMVGVLYEAAAFVDERKVVFSSDIEGIDPNTQSHEEVHVRTDLKKLRERWQVTLPLEESIAYAYGDYIAVNSRTKFTRPSEIRKTEYFSKHSMRMIQCIEYNVRNSGVFGNSLRNLYKNAEPGNKNLALALDRASNFLFYRECIQMLIEHGPQEGLDLLFRSLKIAATRGLEEGWLDIMNNLSSGSRKRIIDESRLKGRELIIRSPYSRNCETDDIEL